MIPTGLQLALAGGALIGLGLALLVWRLTPADPDLADVAERLSPAYARRRTQAAVDPENVETADRVGLWAIRHLPLVAWGKTPHKELALLRTPVHRHYGRKVLSGLLGLAAPPLLTTMAGLIGVNLPVVIPTAGSLIAAAVLFMLPDAAVQKEAVKARKEFTRSLATYLDLVALERNSGAGTRQSMEVAAEIGTNWVFRRLAEELARSRWSGQQPWDALHSLSEELDLPALDGLADIMRLSGEEGAQVYATLRSRSAALRSALLNDELGEANQVLSRLSMPTSLMGIIFMIILIAPALLRMTGA